ncbi:ribonuclease P protein component [Fructilactobacillus cliffordii]|uniref:ribonuclease P protein component n=1 Tax=Fructilactobacillus cliffordii TaxID=2940299 RepID=UPI002093792F|nr:ribonuclease P protein component [Fructilactobacillus cliffordii]USS85958.1 ribonuclease P protein component [Fructilactobacillus cliffordii]
MRKSYRVKKEAEFQRVFDAHQSVANRQFVIYQLEKPDQPHFRVGISVGKKIGNAVHRNWVKRRIRQTLTDLKPQLRQDVDFLVIARPRADGLSMAEVKASMIHVLKLAKLLNPDDCEEEK